MKLDNSITPNCVCTCCVCCICVVCYVCVVCLFWPGSSTVLHSPPLGMLPRCAACPLFDLGHPPVPSFHLERHVKNWEYFLGHCRNLRAAPFVYKQITSYLLGQKTNPWKRLHSLPTCQGRAAPGMGPQVSFQLLFCFILFSGL